MPAPKFKTIIFDLDGTLIDSLIDIAAAANKALADMNLPIHREDAYRLFVGDGLRTLTERIVPDGTEEYKIREIFDRFKVNYFHNWEANTRPYRGVISMLETLEESGVNLAVLSNKPHEFTQVHVTSFFPEIKFGLVLGSRENIPKKPDPQAALELAEHFHTSPRDCIFIGDSRVDMMTGKTAGMISLGVTWGFRKRQELEEAGADIIVNRPEEILEFVLLK